MRRSILIAIALGVGTLGSASRLASQQPPPTAGTAQEQLWDAAISGDTAAIAAALDRGAAIDSLDVRRSPNGRRALNWAAWYNQPAAIELLVKRGATVNIGNHTGSTPLHHAAENGSADAARVLLRLGADPAWPNERGERPIDVARARGHVQLVAILEPASPR